MPAFTQRQPCAAGLVLVLAISYVVGQQIEIPVSEHTVDGFFTAGLDIGTPSQRVWATIDSGSPWLWVSSSDDEKTPGFIVKDSSSLDRGTADSFSYADGVQVEGSLITERVKLGSVAVDNGPLLLAQNASENGQTMSRQEKHVGTLGLTLREEETQMNGYRAESIFDMFSDQSRSEETGVKKLKSFFRTFWGEHSEIPKTYLLALGGQKPRMVVGADLRHGAESAGITFLADFFTQRSNMWYTSLRAIGYSMSSGPASGIFGTMIWNLDFNQWSLEGAPARLDSGSRDIRVGHLVFERLIANMAGGRCRVNEEQAMECPCDPKNIDTEFPWISLSFETYDNYRILGFDVGKDTRVCIPPSAYVFPSTVGQVGTCRLAIVDAGLYQKFFGMEGIVLGVPFFKAVTVGMDLERHRLAFGPPLSYSASMPGMPGGGLSSETMQVEGANGMKDTSLQPQAVCPCADPKNWWNTGHRYSPTRVAVVLCGTAATLLYVFLAFSDTAESFRSQFDDRTGGANGNPGGQNRGGRAGQQQERPFVQMPDRPPFSGPE